MGKQKGRSAVSPLRAQPKQARLHMYMDQKMMDAIDKFADHYKLTRSVVIRECILHGVSAFKKKLEALKKEGKL